MADHKEEIRIVYIDDSPEPELSKFLAHFKREDCVIISEDIIFDPNNNYESLITDQKVLSANIIIIDSLLFENRKVSSGKYTGEEFKLIIRKYFPFIEVIVITQNYIENGFIKVAKYNSKKHKKTAAEYYEENLSNILKSAIDKIFDYRKIKVNLKNNISFDKVLVEKIINSINGLSSYDELTKSDIDVLVTIFKEIQASINEI